jgi:hypothetical protein
MNKEYIYKFKTFDGPAKTDAYFFIISPIKIGSYEGEIFDENNIILKGLWYGVFPYAYPNMNLTYKKYKEMKNEKYWWISRIKMVENFRNLDDNNIYRLKLLTSRKDNILCQFDGDLKEIIEFFFNFAEATHCIQLIPEILSIEIIKDGSLLDIGINDVIHI